MIVGITLVVVVLINAGILLSVYRGRTGSQLKVLSRLITRLRNPMEKQNEAVSELRRRVAGLPIPGSDRTSKLIRQLPCASMVISDPLV